MIGIARFYTTFQERDFSMAKRPPSFEDLPEREVEFTELHKKIAIRTDGSLRSLTDTFAFVSGLIAHEKLRDVEAGLNPKHPTHEVRHDADGKYRIKRLGFNAI
jgi:hypothetical protein